MGDPINKCTNGYCGVPTGTFEMGYDLPWYIKFLDDNQNLLVKNVRWIVSQSGVSFMKIESLREVKTNFSRIIKNLPASRSVVVTKNGRPCAVLFPVTEETDLESLLLAQNNDFWRMFDSAHREGEKKGFTSLEDLPD